MAYRSNPLPPSVVGSTLRSSLKAVGTPHHKAGIIEERRNAKSHGCHGRGTFRTTATRGCRRLAVGAPPLRVWERLVFVGELRFWDSVLERVLGAVFVLAVGVDEARLWVGGRVMTRGHGVDVGTRDFLRS